MVSPPRYEAGKATPLPNSSPVPPTLLNLVDFEKSSAALTWERPCPCLAAAASLVASPPSRSSDKWIGGFDAKLEKNADQHPPKRLPSSACYMKHVEAEHCFIAPSSTSVMGVFYLYIEEFTPPQSKLLLGPAL